MYQNSLKESLCKGRTNFKYMEYLSHMSEIALFCGGGEKQVRGVTCAVTLKY